MNHFKLLQKFMEKQKKEKVYKKAIDCSYQKNKKFHQTLKRSFL